MALFAWAMFLLANPRHTLFAASQPVPQSEPYIVLEFLDPTAGHETEFQNRWTVHMTEMLAADGVTRVERFRRSAIQLRRPSAIPLPEHMAIYSLASDKLPAVEERLKAEFASLGPLVDRDSARIYVYRHTGEWKSAAPATDGALFCQVVFGNAYPGREEDFNRWYNDRHAADLITVPGVVAVNRFVFFAGVQGGNQPPPKYLSMMDFKTDSVERFGEELDKMGSHFVNTDAFDAAHAWRRLYEQAGPELLAGQPHE